MTKPVVIFGLGDYARTARVYLDEDSPHEVVGFTSHERYVDRDELEGLPVVPFEKLGESHPPRAVALLVAIGFSRVNRARADVYRECKALGYEFVTYVSSQSQRRGRTHVGENSFVFEANVIQPNVRIGDDVVLWSGNHIGHDSVVGDHCFLASHVVVSGNVTIGESCFVGVNATLRDGITIAPDCVIGAGALILRDTEPGGVYAVRGTPARDVKSWELTGF